MIAALREWLLMIVTVSLILAVAQSLIPEGSLRSVAGYTGGLVLLLVMLQPVCNLSPKDLGVDLDGIQMDVERRRSELEDLGNEELEAIIAERTGAYISDKADGLGLDISVVVRTEPGKDGIPYPAEVEIQGPRSEELAAYLEKSLGIPEERQVWIGT